MRAANSLGEIITFYSYKGGTGRTMALANIAYLLAQDNSGKSVLMVDWDLAAPGLHRYFRDLVQGHFPNDRRGSQFDAWPGLMDIMIESRRLLQDAADAEGAEPAKSILATIPLDRFVVQTDLPNLFLLKAGSFGQEYASAVNTFDWEKLHALSPWFFRTFAEYLTERFPYVLIDSRTGVTDSSSICSSVMPGTLVLVFTPNRQSLLGALEGGRNAARYRKDSDDLRPLRIFPLASRIESAEPVLRDLWRFGDLEKDVPGYQPAFEMLFSAVYDLPNCDLTDYFSEIQIQHVPRFSYGEEIAVRLESGDRLSLTRSFQGFLSRLQRSTMPWEGLETDDAADQQGPAPLVDGTWIEQKRSLTAAQLAELGVSGWMEATFFISPALGAISQKKQFQAAHAAQVSGTGWPIGAVVAGSGEYRPRPTSGELIAEIVDKSTKSYDYWALREDGSFYFLRKLEEDPEYLLADDRVERITELLLYCKRLYSFLGVEQSTRVRVSVSFGGLQGRALGCRTLDHPDELYRLSGSAVLNQFSRRSQRTYLKSKLRCPGW